MAVKRNTKSVLFRVILPVCLLIAFLPSIVFGGLCLVRSEDIPPGAEDAGVSVWDRFRI